MTEEKNFSLQLNETYHSLKESYNRLLSDFKAEEFELKNMKTEKMTVKKKQNNMEKLMDKLKMQ